MNIEYSNQLPLGEILKKMGYRPISKTKSLIFYNTPLAGGKHTQLIVDVKVNLWSIPEADLKGNVIDLVSLHLEQSEVNHTPRDALRWISNMIGYIRVQIPTGIHNNPQKERKLKFLEANPLTDPSLIYYLENTCCIPFEKARFFLKQISVRNRDTGRKFIAVGIENEEGGYAIRNQEIKAQIGSPYITFIRGRVIKPNHIHIFNNFIDYLSALVLLDRQKFDGDSLILNGYINMPFAGGFIYEYGYISGYTWLDNTEVGKNATDNFAEYFKSQQDLVHVPMNSKYPGHNDVNAYLCSKANKASQKNLFNWED